VEPSRAHVHIDTQKDHKTRPAPMDEKSKQAVVSDWEKGWIFCEKAYCG